MGLILSLNDIRLPRVAMPLSARVQKDMLPYRAINSHTATNAIITPAIPKPRTHRIAPTGFP
jgi:hypothetical protein